MSPHTGWRGETAAQLSAPAASTSPSHSTQAGESAAGDPVRLARGGQGVHAEWESREERTPHPSVGLTARALMHVGCWRTGTHEAGDDC